jgi:hypothetical protein
MFVRPYSTYAERQIGTALATTRPSDELADGAPYVLVFKAK